MALLQIQCIARTVRMLGTISMMPDAKSKHIVSHTFRSIFPLKLGESSQNVHYSSSHGGSGDIQLQQSNGTAGTTVLKARQESF